MEDDYFGTFNEYISTFSSGNFRIILNYEFLIFIGVISLFCIGLFLFMIYRWTGIWLKKTEEPFRYTFNIKPFKRVEHTPGKRFKFKEEDRLNILHHDLMERLNTRVRRLSFLDDKDLNLDSNPQDINPTHQESKIIPSERFSSHISINGHYVIREKNENWIIHIMPRRELMDVICHLDDAF